MATAGTLVFGASFVGLLLLPVASLRASTPVLITAGGIGSGMFAAPNTSSIMSSVPARLRGAASGMRATFQNSGTALSIGIFFSLMIAGLTGTLLTTLTAGLRRHGVSPRRWPTTWAPCPRWPRCSPPSSAFNPIRHLLASHERAKIHLLTSSRNVLTGHTFFPQLISGPFHQGLVVVFTFAAGLSVVAGLASLLRGGRPAAPPSVDTRTAARAEALARPAGADPGPGQETA